MGKKKDSEFFIYIQCDGVIYKFLKVFVGVDGTLYTVIRREWLNLPQQRHKFEVKYEEGGLSSRITESTELMIQTEPIRISYHTSGTVIYHGIDRSTVYFEPMNNITKDNTFFMMSIPSMTSLDKELDQIAPHSQIISFDEFPDQRINIILSVLPPKLPNIEGINGLLTALDVQVATFVAVAELDNYTTNFGKHVPEGTFLLYTPQDGHYLSQVLSDNEAFLQYSKKIYQTNELIILQPDSNGVCRIIFIVEMRTEPFVKIEFHCDNYEIELIRRCVVEVRFKVFDKKKKQYIKKAEDIKIKSVYLDARIYSEGDVLPYGYV